MKGNDKYFLMKLAIGFWFAAAWLFGSWFLIMVVLV